MDHTLQHFIDEVRETADLETLWERSKAFFHGRGAKMMSYRHFVGRPDPNEVPVLYTDGIPQSYLDRMMAERLYVVNPLPELASRSTEPFFWSDTSKLMTLLEEEAAFIDRVLNSGMGDGLSIQVFGPQARNGLVNLGYGGARPAISPREIKELQMASQLGHLTYCRLVTGGSGEPHGMSPREREILNWISRGKSNSVIADILGISNHTVDTHVRRIFAKLDVTDRTTAAIKGLGAGLVQPLAA